MERTRRILPSGTASVLVLRWLVSYSRALGGDIDALLRELEVAPTVLNDPDVRLPVVMINRAWAAFVAASGDDAFGLHLAQHTEEGQFEVLDYAMSFSNTLLEALGRVAQFHRLVADDLAIQVIPDGETTRLVRLVGDLHPHRQDAFFAVLVDRFRTLSGRSFRPMEVSFEHAPHAQRELEAFFRCPVHFARARSELVFATSDLQRPVQGAKPRLAQVLDRYAAELVAQLPVPGSYADRVRQVVARRIERGSPTLEATAHELHASSRTVQRRLAELGTTYARVVDDVRRELAMRYLESPQLSITEIAFLLGYRDDRSFRRAFKTWTGKSPSEARAH